MPLLGSTEFYRTLRDAWGLPKNVTKCVIEMNGESSVVKVKVEFIPEPVHLNEDGTIAKVLKRYHLVENESK